MKNKPLYILLADDDEADRLLFKEAFEELKINTAVHMVKNGVQLMEYLENQESRMPDLIFLDLNMPLKNGLECLKDIRKDKNLKEIAVAIYSTSSSKKDMEETFHNGANIYINKPNDFNTLKQVLKKAVVNICIYKEPPFKKENFLLYL